MSTNESGVFINGKAQIIEMLQYMSASEREKLLKTIRIKNPQLAQELTRESFSFKDIERLSDYEIAQIFHHVNPAIVGIAIKNVGTELQRRILSLASREYAEQAFKILRTPLPNEKRDIKRAQTKIIQILASIGQKNRLKI